MDDADKVVAPEVGRLRRGLIGLCALADRMTSLMNAVGTLWILALVVLINADVVGRGAFGRPISGVPEMVSLSILAIVFLQIANTLGADKMTRADLLLQAVRASHARLGAVIDGIFHLAGAALMAIILYSAWTKLIKSWVRGEYVGAIGNFTAPTWPVNLIVVVGGAAMLIVFLLKALTLIADGVFPLDKETECHDRD